MLPNFSYDPVDEHDNFIDHIDDEELFNPAENIDSSSESVQLEDNIQLDETLCHDDIDVLENERIREEINIDNQVQHDADHEVLNPLDQFKPDDLYQDSEKPIDSVPQHHYSTRSKGAVEQPSDSKSTSRLKKALFHASLTVKQKNKFGVFSNMTVRQAIDKYGIPARRAVMDELQQLIKLNVLKFHIPDQIHPSILKNRLPSKTFVKVKFDSNNEFEKIKARLVGGGDRQKRHLYKVRDFFTYHIVGWIIYHCCHCRQ